MAPKIIVIGIDAASFNLIEHWVGQGKLPVIESLRNRGCYGLVNGVQGFFVGSTWPSFYTGLNPAGHGFYRIEQLKSGSYEFFRPLDSPDGIGGTPFWKVASDAGKRVSVLDVPLSRLEPGLNGTQVVEWGGHDSVFGFQTSSPKIGRRVMDRVGPYPMPVSCDGRRKTVGDFESFIEGYEIAVERKADLTLEFLEADTSDLLVQVFTETHCVGHQCWHLHDPAHPAHDPAVAEVVGDPLERIYRSVDSAIGRIVEAAGDAAILLVSAHGMGAFRGAYFLLPEILFRLNASVQLVELVNPLKAGARKAWNLLSPGMRQPLQPLRNWVRRRKAPGGKSGPRIRADLQRSRCFALPNSFPVGGIRLNLIGREPHGILQPGLEANSFCSQLSRDLRAIVDKATGRPLIARVQRTEDLYRGPRRDALPDLLVEWTDDPPIGSTLLAGGRGALVRATSAKIGTIVGENEFGRSGEHIPTGFFVFCGGGIRSAGRIEPVSVMDFHPTLCALLNVAGPETNGRVIPDVFPQLT